jgi:hypothetical protein
VIPSRFSRNGYQQVALALALPQGRESVQRRQDLAAGARRLSLLGAIAIAAAGAGWLISHGATTAIVGALVVAALAVLAARAPGPLAALLLLAVMNGIPFIDLSGRLPGGAHMQDGAVLALIGLLYARRGTIADPRRARIARAATIWGVCFAGFWLVTLMRSWLLDGIPLLKAALYGRDFLYFALLLPAAIRAEIPARSLRAGTKMLLIGICLFAMGDVAISVAGANLTWLVHPMNLASQVGLTRVFSMMGDLVNACFIFTAAYAMCNKGGRFRYGAALLTLLFGLASILQLTRANYLALGVGLLVGVVVWMLCYASLRSLMLRAIVVTLTVLALVFALLGHGGSSSAASPGGGVVARMQSGISDVSRATGTVGYRETVDAEMLHLLGHGWPVGLGFLHPAYHYVPTLPSGSIRNTDTGVFNVLMTMGLMGLMLVYAPLGYVFRELFRSSAKVAGTAFEPRWIVIGGAAWIAFAVAGSATLVLLFSVSGLAISALVLASLVDHLSSAAESGRI